MLFTLIWQPIFSLSSFAKFNSFCSGFVILSIVLKHKKVESRRWRSYCKTRKLWGARFCNGAMPATARYLAFPNIFQLSYDPTHNIISFLTNATGFVFLVNVWNVEWEFDFRPYVYIESHCVNVCCHWTLSVSYFYGFRSMKLLIFIIEKFSLLGLWPWLDFRYLHVHLIF